MPDAVTYLVELRFAETDDELGVLRMVASDACDLVESHWRVSAAVVDGFDRLVAIAREILDDSYPTDIFGCADDPDADASDPGVRLVRALRACDAARRNGTSAS
jgi:hypothetical protein